VVMSLVVNPLAMWTLMATSFAKCIYDSCDQNSLKVRPCSVLSIDSDVGDKSVCWFRTQES
jgi:hypothetical protein